MARFCTVCAHPHREAIERSVMAGETPYRGIARQFGITDDALRRHAADHLLPHLVRSWQQERSQNGQELITELREWMDRLKMQHDACHAFLLDPDDPSRYTLAPHSWEIILHTSEDQGDGDRPIKRKMRLSDAIAHVDGKPGIGDVVLVESKISDPRELLLKTSMRLETHLRLVGELLGQVQTQGTVNFLATPEWSALEARMLAALREYPAARLALAGALSDEGGTG